MDDSNLEPIHAKLDRLLMIVEGNGGRPGLKTDVALLDERVERIENNTERTRNRWRDVIPTVAGGVAVAVITAIIMSLV